MGPKRSQAPSSQSDIHDEINVLLPPKATKPETTTNPKSTKNPTDNPTTTATTSEHPHKNVKRLIAGILVQVQTLYQEACTGSTPKPETISIKRTAIEAIGHGLEQAYERIKEPCTGQHPEMPGNPTTPHNSNPPPTNPIPLTTNMPAIDERVTSIEKAINEINQSIKALTEPKTWAQVVTNRTTGTGTLSPTTLEQEKAKRERIERGKIERAKTTVTLTLQNDNENATGNPDMTTLQAAINRTKAKDVTIRNMQKLPGKMVRIVCDDEESAKKLRSLQWENLIPGSALVVQEYGIVIHGVPVRTLDARSMPQEHMREIIQRSNNINVSRITPLTKKPRNPEAPTQSIVVFTKSAREANNAIEDGICIEWKNVETLELTSRTYDAKRYNSQHQIRQCFKCQTYGHKAETCTRKAACGRCAEAHDTRKCTQPEGEKAKCIHCGNDHPAWHHDCPRRQQEHAKLKTLIETMPTSFQC